MGMRVLKCFSINVFVVCCRVPEPSSGLRGPARDREGDQRHRPETSRPPERPNPNRSSASPCGTERAGGGPVAISACRSAPSQSKPACSDDHHHRLPTACSQHAAGCSTAKHGAANIAAPRSENTQPRLGGTQRPPMWGPAAEGRRLGVSFCFSRRGPRLEPSASVFSDLEEEERERREHMRDRRKGIMEDIDEEIRAGGEREQQNHTAGSEYQPSSDDCGKRNTEPISGNEPVRVGAKVEGEDKTKDESFISTVPPHHQACRMNHFQFSPPQTQTGFTKTIHPNGHMLSTAHTETPARDREDELEGDRVGEKGEFVCVRAKGGMTSLRWPIGLLKYTMHEPCLTYSCNPLCPSLSHPAPRLAKGTGGLEQSNPNPLSGLRAESPAASDRPAALTQETPSYLEQTRSENPKAQAPNEAAGESVAAEPCVDAAHLLLQTRLHSSSDRDTAGEGEHSVGCEKTEGAAYHPFDSTLSDSSDTNSHNPPGGRLGGVSGIRVSAASVLSCKLESVSRPGAASILSPSRCACGGGAVCACGGGAAVSGTPRKKGSAAMKRTPGKRGDREKGLNQRRVARSRMRSVVATVPTTAASGEQEGGKVGVRQTRSRRRRREREAGGGRGEGEGAKQGAAVSWEDVRLNQYLSLSGGEGPTGATTQSPSHGPTGCRRPTAACSPGPTDTQQGERPSGGGRERNVCRIFFPGALASPLSHSHRDATLSCLGNGVTMTTVRVSLTAIAMTKAVGAGQQGREHFSTGRGNTFIVRGRVLSATGL
ncbi:hypothetical protein NHX12_001754 [Muraenolepis orangiensis]|uniref:Uncharacterized protein n=1 Tax=Muraenolepis orangiensis TaxID=630683 RepID=A0A9Q0IHJ5_9TELE|nr:hypothetical protein NHX12_001754 [Muraenolepis orangiensis]